MVEVGCATPDEYDEIGRITVAAYRALPGGVLDAEYEAELAGVAARASAACILAARENGRVIGGVTLVEDSDSPYAEMLEPADAGIRMLAVAPEAQGRGAGRALVEACIERARRLGKRRVTLHSTPWMETAHRLYLRLGFRRDEARDWLPVPDVPLLGFVLDLGGDTQ